jgi:hypothetical protein
MSASRPWYTGVVLTWKTVMATLAMLRKHRLGALIPLFGLLLLGAMVLWLINTIAPLAPFVYSLF